MATTPESNPPEEGLPPLPQARSGDPVTQRIQRLVTKLSDHRPEQAPTDMPQAAVAIVLRFDRATDVLLMQRARREGDRWSGQISLPGGHVDAGDADMRACAVRETSEELGLDLDQHGQHLGRLDSIQARARGGLVPLWITPIVFAQLSDSELTFNHEAEDAFRLPLGPVIAGDLDADYPFDRGEVVVQLPSWRFRERTVWGLTHRILSGLIEVGAGTLH